ncbi:MAG: hypothetical protein V1875_09485 [Candidatus Altiarchaeota archaeon]
MPQIVPAEAGTEVVYGLDGLQNKRREGIYSVGRTQDGGNFIRIILPYEKS